MLSEKEKDTGIKLLEIASKLDTLRWLQFISYGQGLADGKEAYNSECAIKNEEETATKQTQ